MCIRDRLIVVATAWLGFTFLELIFSLYGRDAPEIALRELQIFTWPWNLIFITFLFSIFSISMFAPNDRNIISV